MIDDTPEVGNYVRVPVPFWGGKDNARAAAPGSKAQDEGGMGMEEREAAEKGRIATNARCRNARPGVEDLVLVRPSGKFRTPRRAAR